MPRTNANKTLTPRQFGFGRDVRNIAEYVLPPLVAAFAVSRELLLTRLSRSHEAVLPLGTMLLLAMLLHARLRKYLVVTLCYGVAFLAVRDSQRVAIVPLPPALSYDWVYNMQPIGLWLVAVLACVAGVAETARPGTVWARRCYFGAAALYFTGLGVMNFAWTRSWQSVLLCFTGLTALIGCALAHCVVAAESVVETPPPADDVVQRARDEAHHKALQTKEWHDETHSLGNDPETHSVNPWVDVSTSI